MTKLEEVWAGADLAKREVRGAFLGGFSPRTELTDRCACLIDAENFATVGRVHLGGVR